MVKDKIKIKEAAEIFAKIQKVLIDLNRHVNKTKFMSQDEINNARELIADTMAIMQCDAANPLVDMYLAGSLRGCHAALSLMKRIVYGL